MSHISAYLMKGLLGVTFFLSLLMSASAASCTRSDFQYYEDGDYIFLSLSMPRASIKQWLQQAQKAHMSVILRGFIDGDLKKTIARVKEYASNTSGLSIDPIAYQRYHIDKVPAVLRVQGSAHDVVYGNVSLKAAQHALTQLHTRSSP